LDPEERVAHLTALEELGDDVAHGRRRDREPEALRAGRGGMYATLIPTTSPSPLHERSHRSFPGEIAASVWIRSISSRGAGVPPGIVTAEPEMIPAVTCSRSRAGLPIATASSPTRGSSSANVDRREPLPVVADDARSVSGSTASTSPAARRPSANAISTGRSRDDVMVGDDHTVGTPDDALP
jgi:hypothetical protein